AAVDLNVLKRNLRVEMHVQDTIVPGSATLESAWTRERFVVDPTATAPTVHSAAFQPVPTPTLVNATHPPILSWPELTQGEGAHCLQLLSSILGTSWRIYLAAQAPGSTVTFQVPAMPNSLPDGLGQLEFAIPGKYLISVTSYDFDPFHVFSAATPEQYDFN